MGYLRHKVFRAALAQIETQSMGAGKRAAEKEPAAAKPKVEAQEARGAEPPRGYADFTVADINEKSKRWKLEQLEAALEFEQAHANRKGALAALEAAIAAKQEKEG